MDRTESTAYEYLRTRFPGEDRIVYEPDGQSTPDFVIDGLIAVEVRRLSEHDIDTPPRALEETEIPLVRHLNRLLESQGTDLKHRRMVALRFGRPLPPWRDVEIGTLDFIQQIELGHIKRFESVEVAPRIRLTWLGDGGSPGTAYHLATWSDQDEGGALLPILHRNLQIAIREKSAKTASHRHKYPEWWLLLVDHIAYGVSQRDEQEFRERYVIQHDWDKVLLVGPRPRDGVFEL